MIIPGAETIWPKARPHKLEAFADTLIKRLSAEELNNTLDRFAQMREGKGGISHTPLGKLPLVLEEKKREFRADCAKIVKELAEKHGVMIETTKKAESPEEGRE